MIVNYKTPIYWPKDSGYVDKDMDLVSEEMLNRIKKNPSGYCLCSGDNDALVRLTNLFESVFADRPEARGVVLLATKFSYIKECERSDRIEYCYIEDLPEEIFNAYQLLGWNDEESRKYYDFVASEADGMHLSKEMHHFMRALTKK